MKVGWQHSIFWMFFFLEIGALLLLFSIASGFGIVVIVVPLVGGAFTSAIGCLAPPRSWPVFVFGLHVVVLGYLFGGQALRERQVELQDQRREQAEQEAALQQRLRTELVALLERKDLPAARRFVQDHRELRPAGIPLSTVLCPSDHAEPDLALLRLLIERGAPQGGDLLLEASKCTLSTFRSVMALGVPATAVSSTGIKPMMVARDLALLDFLVREGRSVDARGPEGKTPLMYHRTPEVTRFLLSHGAHAKMVDAQGRSALHFGGPAETLAGCYELLLEAGADPNLQDRTSYRDTPLLAMDPSRGRPWIQAAADMLVAHGANPLLLVGGRSVVGQLISHRMLGSTLEWPGLDLSGRGGAHLLMVAIRTRQINMVNWLLDAGANPLVADYERAVPRDRFRDYFRNGREAATYQRMSEFGRGTSKAPDAGF